MFFDTTQSANYLAVISGGTSNNVHILNLNDNEWLDNVPSLNVPRLASACIAHDGWLYSIGGLNSSSDAFGEGGTGEICCECQEASSSPNCDADAECTSYVLR